MQPTPRFKGVQMRPRKQPTRWCIGLLLLLFLSAAPSSLQAQSDPPLTLAAYQQKLEAWQTALTDAREPSQVTAIQTDMAAIHQIVLPSGVVITVQPLLGEPGTEPIDLATARQRITTVLAELKAAGQDQTAARLQLLTAIFQRPEFVEHDSLWQRFWRWLRAWLPRFETNENPSAPIAPLFQWIGWALFGLGALLLIWLLSYWLQNLLGSFMGGVERRATTAETTLPETAAAARTSAHKLADAGSYREAVRHLYLAALLALHERNLLTYQPSDTNREVLAAVRAQPRLHQQLQPVVETFDNVWYGIHEPDRTAFDQYAAAVEKLEEVP